MKNIEKRLKQFLAFKKITTCDTESETTLAATTVSKFLDIYPELNADWLITGRGPMIYTPAITIPEDIKDYADLIDDIEKA